MSKRPLDSVADEPDGKMARLDATAVPGVVKKTGRAEEEAARVDPEVFLALALECCTMSSVWPLYT